MRPFATAPALLLFIGQSIAAFGQDAHLRTSIYTQATLSDNVFLAPKGQEQTDLFFQVTPTFELIRNTARLDFALNYSPSLNVYPFSSGSMRVTNNLQSTATARLIENFLFLDASAAVTQSFLSPFGPRTSSQGNLNDNQTELATFGISPYIRGKLRNGFTYLARNDTFYTTSKSSSVQTLLDDHASATVESPRTSRARLGLDFDYRYTKYESIPYYYTTIARIRPGLQLRPNLLIGARAGFEKNNYTSDQSGVVYGATISWQPTPRTNLDAFAEHRFFGTGYNVNFSHRTRLTSWRLSARRDIQNYREQGLTLQPGFTAVALNDALTPRIPDFGERLQAIERILANAGLPPVLFSPYTFLANQPYLSHSIDASSALLTRRNTATLHFFWQDNKPVVEGGAIGAFPDVFTGSNSFKQHGGGLALSHRLTATTTATLDLTRTYATRESFTLVGPTDSKSDAVRISLTKEFTPKTHGSVGVRWVSFQAESSDSVEHAIYASLQHSF